VSTNLAITVPIDKLVIPGPVKVSDTNLTGFQRASRLLIFSRLRNARREGRSGKRRQRCNGSDQSGRVIAEDKRRTTVEALDAFSFLVSEVDASNQTR
jgi:hypothetical protein